MSYQVLARKWRPRSFEQVVGQEHVVRALTNALERQRLHHAYLFTGTRGVGKTTLARILAKALNCEKGITSTPCGQCQVCNEIDKGRFVDLLEVDAASNTQVDAMRELLENAQYAPTVGRFKVYIIDEVHMLSRSAFNAMLKTLEEPPEHVKFILATTDPQKVPVTVLSRCLQFNLKQMSPTHIAAHLKHILEQEGIAADSVALHLLSRAAHGSMRDALSLLDQAIAYGDGKVREHEVHAMLGAIDQDYLFSLLECLAAGDGPALIRQAEAMEERSLSFDAALQDLAALLHQIALGQTVPQALAEDLPERPRILALAQRLSPELVQLYYQIATLGRRDLPLAPDEFAGFSMTLLRMLAFTPATQWTDATTANVASAPIPTNVSEPAGSKVDPAASQPVTSQAFNGNWRDFVESLKPGFAKKLAENCELESADAHGIVLRLDEAYKHLLEPSYLNMLKAAIKERFGDLSIHVQAGGSGNTPAAQITQEKAQRQAEAEASIHEDAFVRDMIKTFGETITLSNIKPIQ
ncbi:MAG: DNA polymerase III subunit gamma/tau [Methylophilaceae bacterium]|nr:DNA polymerase III subunit gamma/tau [Methylophilaceae bacterium]